MHCTTHHDHGFGLAGLFDGLGDAFRIFSRITELEGLHRPGSRSTLAAPLGIQQSIDPSAGIDTHVMTAVRADIERRLQVFFVKHRFTGGALNPYAFRHPLVLPRPAITAIVAVDARGKDLVYPTHCSFPNISGWAG